MYLTGYSVMLVVCLDFCCGTEVFEPVIGVEGDFVQCCRLFELVLPLLKLLPVESVLTILCRTLSTYFTTSIVYLASDNGIDGIAVAFLAIARAGNRLPPLQSGSSHGRSK